MSDGSKTVKLVSEQEIRQRLAGTLTTDEIDDLIDNYIEVASSEIPDMETINRLADKSTESRLLRVSFNLELDQYDALSKYYNEKGRPGTTLMKKALEDFLRLIVD